MCHVSENMCLKHLVIVKKKSYTDAYGCFGVFWLHFIMHEDIFSFFINLFLKIICHQATQIYILLLLHSSYCCFLPFAKKKVTNCLAKCIYEM